MRSLGPLLGLLLVGSFAGSIAPPALRADPPAPSWEEIPANRLSQHGAVLDAARHRMLVFGGIGPGSVYHNDVWTLTLDAPHTFARLATAGTRPSGRIRPSLIYDPVGDRLILYGGYDTGIQTDVWQLTLGATPTWSSLQPSGTPPDARIGQAAAYDPVARALVIMGGYNGTTYGKNDVWVLSLAGPPVWSHPSLAGPVPIVRENHSMVYDSARDRFLVFGGDDGACCPRGDVWALTLRGAVGWTALAPGGAAPSQRYHHAAVYDPVRDRMLVFAGVQVAWPYRIADVYQLTLSGTPTWSALSTAFSNIEGRSALTAIYDPAADEVVTYGGELDYSGSLRDVWVLSPAAGDQMQKWTFQPRRALHAGVFDPVRRRVVVFGGVDGPDTYIPRYQPPESNRNDVWTLDLDGPQVWTQLNLVGAPPARRMHSAIYDPIGDRMIVFGGLGDALRNDVWALSLAGPPQWTEIHPVGTPPAPRCGHGAIYDPGRRTMMIFGGATAFPTAASFPNPFAATNEVWELSLTEPATWRQVSFPAGTEPPPRLEAVTAFDPFARRLMIYGGDAREDNSGPHELGDLWSLDLEPTPSWTWIVPDGVGPGPREFAAGFFDTRRNRLVIHGGSQFYPQYDISEVSLDASPVWSHWDHYAVFPDPRAEHVAVYDSAMDRMVIEGGFGLGGPADNFDRYKPDTWIATWPFDPDLVGVPAPATRPGLSLARVRPNPAGGTLTATVGLPGVAPAWLEIFDLSGRRVLRLPVSGPGTSEVRVDGLDALAPGVYLLRLEQGRGSATARIAILH